MFHHHSIIPWGSFRGRQEEKWRSFQGWDHFGINLGIISGLGIILGSGSFRSGAVQIATSEVFPLETYGDCLGGRPGIRHRIQLRKRKKNSSLPRSHGKEMWLKKYIMHVQNCCFGFVFEAVLRR